MTSPDESRRTAALLVEAALGRQARIGCAESCTGGLIAAALTSVPGVSAVFPGGIVAYENGLKERLLGVSAELLEQYGAVSREVVLAMADGAAARLEADAVVAVSGIAGPDGGTLEKPVGTVWFAVSCCGTAEAFRRHFDGDRETIRNRAALEGLVLLHAALSGRD